MLIKVMWVRLKSVGNLLDQSEHLCSSLEPELNLNTKFLAEIQC